MLFLNDFGFLKRDLNWHNGPKERVAEINFENSKYNTNFYLINQLQRDFHCVFIVFSRKINLIFSDISDQHAMNIIYSKNSSLIFKHKSMRNNLISNCEFHNAYYDNSMKFNLYELKEEGSSIIGEIYKYKSINYYISFSLKKYYKHNCSFDKGLVKVKNTLGIYLHNIKINNFAYVKLHFFKDQINFFKIQKKN